MTKFVYKDRAPQYCSVSELSAHELDLLTQSESFCILPWVHMHSYPDGRVYPCCMAEYNNEYASLHTHSMESVWNSDKYKHLRSNMLHNVKSPDTCKKCYEQEAAGFFSVRNDANKTYGHHIHDIHKTFADGTHPEFKIRHWDVRFSNLCNLKCRTCGPPFSSQWFQDYVRMFGQKPSISGRELKQVEYAGRHKNDILAQMEEHIPDLEQIYFAGGEPLVMEEHYTILQKLIDAGRTDVRLMYNTNFTQLALKKQHVFDYWKHFDTVNVGASLDAEFARAEILRSGTKWQTVVNNRKLLQRELPNVDFYLAATLSVINSLHITDFHRHWVDEGLVGPGDLNLNICQSPEWYRIDILPQNLKSRVVEKFNDHIEWLRPIDKLTRAVSGFESAVNFLLANDNQSLIPRFLKETDLLDNVRGEKLLDVFTELQELENYR